MTAAQLLDALTGADRFVILDGEPVSPEQLLAMQHVLIYQRAIESHAQQSAAQRAKSSGSMRATGETGKDGA